MSVGHLSGDKLPLPDDNGRCVREAAALVTAAAAAAAPISSDALLGRESDGTPDNDDEDDLAASDAPAVDIEEAPM